MNIGFLSPSLSRVLGGIFEIERDLALALDALPDTRVTAYGLMDHETANDAPAWRHIPCHVGAIRGVRAFGYSPQLRAIMARADEDILHLHSLWTYTSVLALAWKQRTGRPYVTTANGMLEPWALNNSVLKKRAAALFYERRALRALGCLHVNTVSELESARAFGLQGPFCIIPNGVALPGPVTMDKAPTVVRSIRAAGGQIMLQLGRLHPKKNIAAAIEAFAQVAPAHQNWHFVIAGWGDDGYRKALEQQAQNSQVASRIHFAGPVFGEEKAATLAAANAFILASHSEGFPMAILEAFANALPVIMTRHCNLHSGFDIGAAIDVGPKAHEIARGMADMLAASDQDRRAMGAKGRGLVEQRFSWNHVARDMRAVYAWLLGGGSPPASVVS